jgi:hypothetical protein
LLAIVLDLSHIPTQLGHLLTKSFDFYFLLLSQWLLFHALGLHVGDGVQHDGYSIGHQFFAVSGEGLRLGWGFRPAARYLIDFYAFGI